MDLAPSSLCVFSATHLPDRKFLRAGICKYTCIRHANRLTEPVLIVIQNQKKFSNLRTYKCTHINMHVTHFITHNPHAHCRPEIAR